MKKKRPIEANLLSFRVIIDNTGAVVTEYGGIKKEDIYKVFKTPKSLFIEKIFNVVQPKFDNLHNEIQERLGTENDRTNI